MRKAAWALAVGVVWGGAAACSAPPSVERDPVPLIQTDALEYPLTRNEVGYRATIPYTFRNETGEAVVLPNCEGDVRPLLEVLRGGTSWFEAWKPYTVACESEAVVIAPGEIFTDTLHLFGTPPASNVLPTFLFPEVEGVYRLVWYQARAASDTSGALLPLEERVSNPFVLLR